jgi:tRNA pseudouridine13 synthase
MLRLTKGKTARGLVKGSAEDFVVQEILQGGHILERDRKYKPEELGLIDQEGKFTIFILQKTNWNTAQALKTIAKRLKRGIKSTGFAGTKDRTSVSTQLCSMFGVWPVQLQSLHIKDISINGAWEGKNKIKMGELLGNNFHITIREPEDCNNIPGLLSELNGIFPNYFGEQRFGNRGTNFDIGLEMLKGNFRDAVMKFLTDTQNETKEEAKEARERLAQEQDFESAFEYFPEYLKYERAMIRYLAKYPTNFANAIRSIPRSISLMFIHSVEAQIFNKELEERIKENSITANDYDLVCYADSYGFPDLSAIERFSGKGGAFPIGNIIGYDTKELTDFEKGMLEELDITQDSFKVKGLDELHSKGTCRPLFAPYKDANTHFDEQENSYKLDFSLPSGSYATVLLDELLAE